MGPEYCQKNECPSGQTKKLIASFLRSGFSEIVLYRAKPYWVQLCPVSPVI
jgi:hypothetical protein